MSSASHLEISKRVHQGCTKCLKDSIRRREERIKKGEITDSESLNVRWPRYRKEKSYTSFAVMQDINFRFVYEENTDGKIVRKLKLSKIKGPIRCYNQSTPLPGEPKMCIISKKDVGTHYEYFASVACEYEPMPRSIRDDANTVGIDVGLTHIMVTSDNKYYDNPHAYGRMLKDFKDKHRSLSEAIPNTEQYRKKKSRLVHQYDRLKNIRKNTIENAT